MYSGNFGICMCTLLWDSSCSDSVYSEVPVVLMKRNQNWMRNRVLTLDEKKSKLDETLSSNS